MPTFYNYSENGVAYSFDDVFVPADVFRQGNLLTWGYGSQGALGINLNGATVIICTPVTTFTGGANWKQVDCGSTHTAAIKTDGTLWTWGYGGAGQLGDDTGLDRSTPVQVFGSATNWRQVAANASHTAAIKTDGTLWTWGFNSSQQLGINVGAIFRICTPVQVFGGATNWKQVSCGNRHMTAVKTDGTLWTWGYNTFANLGINVADGRTTPVQVFGSATNWKQVSCGYNHTIAIKTDGTLWCWGKNDVGQLGINDTNIRCTPVQTSAGGTNWKTSIGGRDYTAAIKTDGTLWTWGKNDFGQLGVNDTNMRCTPVQVFGSSTNWKQLGISKREHTVAIKTDGTLWNWGRNFYGVLGINAAGAIGTDMRCTPVTTFAGGTNWRQASSGWYHTVALTYDDPVI